MPNRLTSLAFVAALWMLASCTTEKDGRAYRLFHNTTARYNGYFYATEALKEADAKLEELHDERWDETLPLFLESDEETAQQIYPLMERAIEKCTRVVDRHTMAPSSRNRKSFDRPVMNKWIDDNYTVIGQSYYMKGDYAKAEEIFTYLSRTVASPDAEAWAFSWLGRTYMRTGNEVKAKNALGKAESLRDASDEAMIHTQLVLAQNKLLDELYEAAIGHLENALSRMKKRDPRRARTTFVLAQCLRDAGEIERAIEQFQLVAEMKWEDYEWIFQGNIQQAMTYERRNGNSEAIVELLEDMLENKKNGDFKDQIYYALGEVALEDRQRDESFSLFKQSVAAHVDNDRQLGKGYLKLADLYMEDLEYPIAQAYYDSALVYMEEDNDRKEEVSSLASDLTSLVNNLNIINEVDSLLNICDMDEDMRIRVVDRVLRDMELDLERQREEREAAREAAAAEAASNTAGAGMFWPYNGSLRASGQQEFLDYWGERVLEDDWRRSNKFGNLFSEDEEEDEDLEGGEQESLDPLDPANLPTFDELLASLPCETDERVIEEERLAEAYYNAGLDYREKLNDNKKAIETWTELIEVLDSSEFHPTAHYQLFRTYLEREIEENYQNPFCDDCNSEYWAAEILRLYPGSEWARLIEDPEFLDEAEILREAQREEYEALLNRYYLKDYQQVLLDIDEVLARDSANAFECKHRLLRTQCVGGLTSYTGDRTPYFDALATVVRDCPDTEEAAFAQELMRKLGVALGDEIGDPKDEQEEKPASQSDFAVQPNNEHYFAIFIPVGRGNGDQVKAQAADFNNAFFGSKRLKVTSNLLDRSTQVVLVKSFRNMQEGMDYYTVFTGNREDLIDVNSAGYEMVLISNENYVSLFKNKDIQGYAQFFAEHYLSAK